MGNCFSIGFIFNKFLLMQAGVKPFFRVLELAFSIRRRLRHQNRRLSG
jgi:hypothetical protein